MSRLWQLSLIAHCGNTNSCAGTGLVYLVLVAEVAPATAAAANETQAADQCRCRLDPVAVSCNHTTCMVLSCQHSVYNIEQ